MKPNLKKLPLSIAKIIFLILKEVGEITAQSFFHNSHASRFGYGYGPKYCKNYHSTVSRLNKKGFIFKKNGVYRLTSKGEKEAFFSLLESYKLDKHIQQGAKPEKWDKKWRIIFFDIPEKKRRYRDELRSMLKVIGFKEFQKSIWIYPYSVPKFLKDILFEEGIKQYIRFITTSTNDIEYDKDLRKKFSIET
ncbi:MAG: hypothetical protein Q8R55_01700 [Candidatus Taylorbacteria bacterium]|nr:hypothetical protein [Candidatus Taylorbacteria bacterium]